MKNRRRIQPIALLALAGLSALSCAKFSGTEQVLPQDGGCLVTLSVGEPQTKAYDYITVRNWERQISSLQIIIYDKNGSSSSTDWTIADSYRTTYSSPVTSASYSTRLPAGTYFVEAVANMDEDFTGSTYSYILENSRYKHYLSDEEDYSSDGFQAEGGRTLTISEGSTSASASLTLSRFVGRVALNDIYNSTGQTVTINRVWLSNVVTTYNYRGSNSWGNWMGRYSYTNSSSIIGSASDADCPECTFWDADETISNSGSFSPTSPVLFYTLENSSSVTPSGWSSSWSDSKGQKTALVIDATVNGTQCYYPVVLDEIRANYTYTVSVSLYAIGSPDPNDPNGRIVTDVSFDAEITVNEWDDGVEYDYTY